MILITGGAGFIGSNIIAALEEAGYTDLAIADTLGTDEKWKNIAKRTLSAIIEPADLTAFLAKRGDDITAVIHMGAISATTETDADLIVRTNVTLSWELWEFCTRRQIPFIYASSAATYGAGENNFTDRNDLPYLKALRPLNAYGWSKALFDRMVYTALAAGKPHPRQYAGLKFFNVYGPNEYHKGGQKSVVAHIFPNVRDGKTVELFKSYRPDVRDGEQLRDFVWVGDCVRVVLWLLKHPDVSGLFNVGTGRARSFYDLAAATFAAMNQSPRIGFKDMPETLRDKYQYYTQADLNALRAAGFDEPMTSLEDGIRQYVQNYLNTADPYR